MHCAVRGGKEDIVQLVIRNSSKINVKSKDGKTALDLAVDKFSHLRPLIEEARLQKIPWKEIKAEGKSPIPRSGHSASPYNNRWYIYGGANDLLDPVTIFDDILFFNGDTHEWRFLNPAQGKDGRPPALYLHSSVIISGKLYIFGGMDLSKVYNDIWVLDLGTFFSSYLFFYSFPSLISSTSSTPPTSFTSYSPFNSTRYSLDLIVAFSSQSVPFATCQFLLRVQASENCY